MWRLMRPFPTVMDGQGHPGHPIGLTHQNAAHLAALHLHYRTVSGRYTSEQKPYQRTAGFWHSESGCPYPAYSELLCFLDSVEGLLSPSLVKAMSAASDETEMGPGSAKSDQLPLLPYQ